MDLPLQLFCYVNRHANQNEAVCHLIILSNQLAVLEQEIIDSRAPWG